MSFAIPVPTVSVTPLSRMALPRLMLPVEVPPTAAPPFFTFSSVFESPRVITLVPAAATFPMRLIAEGAVAMMPPVKLKVSVPASPKVIEPPLPKVVKPAMLLLALIIFTL